MNRSLRVSFRASRLLVSSTLASSLLVSSLLAASFVVSGCYNTVVKSGRPAAAAVTENADQWHSGLIGGLAELSGPYELQKRCPGGWGEVETVTSFPNGLVTWVTFNIYSPQTVTIRCAGGAVAPAGAPAGTGTPSR